MRSLRLCGERKSYIYRTTQLEFARDELLDARREIYGTKHCFEYAGRLIHALHEHSVGSMLHCKSQRGRHIAYREHLSALGLLGFSASRMSLSLLSSGVEGNCSASTGCVYKVGDTTLKISVGNLAEEIRRYSHCDQEFPCWTRQPGLAWQLNDHSATFYEQFAATEAWQIQSELMDVLNTGFEDPAEDIEELLFETSPTGSKNPLLLMLEKGLVC